MSWTLLSAPLPLVGGTILLVLFGCVELGYRGRAWLERHGEVSGERREGESFLLSAALGVLAILLGFTFSMALDRYETRRDLVTYEAVALSAVWLHVELMPEPARTQSLADLRSYVRHRVAWSEGKDEEADPTIATLQLRLWRAASQLPRGSGPEFLGPDLRARLQESFSIAAERAAAREAHVPQRVIWILLLYTALSATLLGYVLRPTRTHHRTAASVLTLLLTISLVLILDSDRPRSGAVQVSQRPMEQLGTSLEGAVRTPP